MSLSSRSFPYPVLAAFNDDYLDAAFLSSIDLLVDSSSGASEITINFDLGTTSGFLSDLYETQKASFYLDVFSKQTLLRQTVEVSSAGSLSFPNGELFGTVELTPYLLTKIDIDDYPLRFTRSIVKVALL
jgi:hypothetical protein